MTPLLLYNLLFFIHSSVCLFRSLSHLNHPLYLYLFLSLSLISSQLSLYSYHLSSTLKLSLFVPLAHSITLPLFTHHNSTFKTCSTCLKNLFPYKTTPKVSVLDTPIHSTFELDLRYKKHDYPFIEVSHRMFLLLPISYYHYPWSIWKKRFPILPSIHSSPGWEIKSNRIKYFHLTFSSLSRWRKHGPFIEEGISIFFLLTGVHKFEVLLEKGEGVTESGATRGTDIHFKKNESRLRK